MTTASPIAKRSNSGFTVLPNRLVDQVLASGTTHTVDTLALALYLVRHIPGQRGALVLAGDFSQATLCQDLGWGRTNRARLKRALSDLERLEIVTTELRDNNTVVVHVNADLPTGVGEASIPTGCKDSSQGEGAPKLFAHLGQENSSQASRASDSSASNSKMMKNPKTLNHHLLSAELRENRAREAELATTNDVQKLLDLYRSSLKKPVSIDVAALFAQNYLANGRPFKLVEDAIKALASNPLLHAATMSPNAVWQLAYMKQRSARADASIRAYIRDRRYSSEPDEQLRNSITEFATQNGYDEAIFLTFYATIVDDLFAQRIQDREDRAKWESDNRDSHVFTAPDSSGELDANPFSSAPAAEPSALELHASQGITESPTLDPKASPDDSTSSVLSSDQTPLAASAEQTADLPASPNKPDETPPESTDPAHCSIVSGCASSLPDPPADIGDLGSNRVEVPRELTSQPRPSRRAEVPDKPSHLDPLCTPEFLAAKNKNDFARIVVQALKTVTCPEAKRSLTLFAELVAIDRMKFEELRKIVTRHSSPPKRIAA